MRAAVVASVLFVASPAFAAETRAPAAPVFLPALGPVAAPVLDDVAAPSQAPPAAAAAPAAGSLAAVGQELSGVETRQLAGMPAEEAEGLAGRVMDGRGLEAPFGADWPPTSAGGLDGPGLTLALMPPKERPLIFPETGMLGKILLTPDSQLGPVADEALRREPNLSRTLFDLFASLRGVIEGSGPAGARAAAAVAVRDKFAAFLRAVRSPGRRPAYRAMAGRGLHRMLLSGALLEELFHARQVGEEARRLREALDAAPVSPRVRAAVERSRAPASGGWRIPARLPDGERASEAAEPEVLYTSLGEFSERLDRHAFRLEKQSRRAALAAADPRFSDAFRAKQTRRLARVYLSAERYRRWLEDALAGYVGNRLLNQLIAPPAGERGWAPLHVPDNPNLSLTLGEDGLVLRAALTTDIREPELAAYAKASIEDYWRGSLLDAEGRAMPLRTELTVRVLKPGEAFAPTDLRLVETAGHGDYGTRLGIGVSRLNMSWGTMAHEFGHVLGLPDEYFIEYDVRGRRVKQTSFPGSLMSDSARGVVQPRHLANVFNLLGYGGRFRVEDQPR